MQLVWDQVGERTYETGVDHGVLYVPDPGGAYSDGFAWSGLTTVTESPSGADANASYADNIKYLNLYSAEQFGFTIEAYTFPPEFEEFDGLAVPAPGISVGQQSRKRFGFSFRTKKGNDVLGDDAGHKVHLVYGCTASPSEKAYASVNDSPAAIQFSWQCSTVPVAVAGLKPTSLLTIDSTVVNAAALAALETLLYGAAGVNPRLPLPDEVIALFTAAIVVVPPLVAPAYNAGTHTITIPVTAGVTYYIDGVAKAAGPVVITHDTIVTARPNAGYVLSPNSDDDWFFDYV